MTPRRGRRDTSRSASDEAFRAEGEILEAARLERSWEADVFPLLGSFENDPGARPCLATVMAGPFAIRSDALSRMSGEVEDVARKLSDLVEDAAGLVGAWPREVVVRHAEIARHLEKALRPRGCRVRPASRLPALDAMACGFLFPDEPAPVVRPVLSLPHTWAAWGLPEHTLRRLFAAAAAFRSADPRNDLTAGPALRARFPDGRCWYVTVFRIAEGDRALAFHEDAGDLRVAVLAGAIEEVCDKAGGRFYNLLFERRGELPPPMSREFSRRGWRVAGPDAYPRLLAGNTPGGGVRVQDAEELIATLNALACLARERGERVGEPWWEAYRDPGTGVELAPLDEDDWDEDGPIDAEDALDEGWPSDEDEWDEPLAGNGLGGIAGGASPLPPFLDGMLSDEDRDAFDDVLRRDATLEEIQDFLGGVSTRHNQAPQDELGGLSPEEVRNLLDADWSDPDGPLHLERALADEEVAGSRTLRNARRFLDALAAEGRTRATAKGNLNRAFVATMGEALERPSDSWAGLLKEYRRVVNEEDDGELHTLRVLLDLAALVKKRKSWWSLTRSGDALRREGRGGEFYTLLFETFFRKLNLAYLDRIPAGGELQYQISFALDRFGEAGREWTAPEELVDRLLLPFTRESVRRYGTYDPTPALLEGRFLLPLEGFGLAEREEVAGAPRHRPRYRYRTTPLYERFLRFGG